MSVRSILAVAGLATLLMSCGPRTRESSSAASQSAPERVSNRSCTADTVRQSIRSLAAASYDLQLISTRTSRDVRGSLELAPQQDSLVDLGGGSRMPLVGSAAIAVEQVGALRLGDLGSKDPRRPGVVVLEQGQASGLEVLLRFGSSANERGRIRFDGGYFVLRVRSVTDEGFYGVWVSGITDDTAGGFFCAWRTRS